MVINRICSVALRNVSISATRQTRRTNFSNLRLTPPVSSLIGSHVSSFGYATSSMVSSSNEDSGSHNDFAPKRKTVSDEDEAFKLIGDQVKNNPVMLYMKGNPSMPMCGFSAKVVQILKTEGVDFSSVNVLDYPAIREGIKKYSEWPTIPQLYVNGEFIGGCDIVTSMHQSGELAEALKEVAEEK